MHWQRIEDLKIDNDLTQKQVADILNCKREVYRCYGKGIRKLPLSYAIILAKQYHVTLNYLVGLSDNKFPDKRETNTETYKKCETHKKSKT